MHQKIKILKYLLKTINFYIKVLAFLPILAYSQSSKPMVVDKIIAKVDNYIVLKSDVESIYLNYVANGERVDENTMWLHYWHRHRSGFRY